MTVAYGVQSQKINNEPRDMVPVDQWHGRVRVQHDSYEASALEAASTIAIAKLPANSRVCMIGLHWDALGTGTTIDIGDADNDDRFLSAEDTSSAGNLLQLPLIAGHQYQYTEETVINITTAGIMTGSIQSSIFYTVD